MGSNAVDGKRLILDSKSFKEVVNADSRSLFYLRKYGGTKELLSGNHRWCLWVADSQLDEVLAIPDLRKIIANCHKYRLGAGRDAKKAAARPHAFCYSTYEDKDFIHVGNTIGNALRK